MAQLTAGLSIPEVAEELGMSRASISEACRRGHIKGARKIGRQWVLTLAAAKEWHGNVRRPPGNPNFRRLGDN